MEVRPGVTLPGRYEVLARIGSGGFASVFSVRHRTMGTLHALNVLHQQDAAVWGGCVDEAPPATSFPEAEICQGDFDSIQGDMSDQRTPRSLAQATRSADNQPPFLEQALWMWIPTDFPTFLDALTIADRYHERLRVTSPDVLLDYGLRVGVQIPIEAVLSPIEHHMPHQIAVIERGLYAGVYRYDMDRQFVFRWLDAAAPTYPLRVYPQDHLFDVAISYSGRSWAQHAKPLHDALVAAGLSVYAIVHSDDADLRERMTNDPLWRIRYREGMFRSRYVVPVCTASYLDASGSREEMFELARVAVQHRHDEHFYPIIPWFPPEELPLESLEKWRGHGEDQHLRDLTAYDSDSFTWIRHLFPFPPDWSHTQVARFLMSLSRGASALGLGESAPDTDFLEMLAPYVGSAVWVGAEEIVHFTVRHAWWPNRAQSFGTSAQTGFTRFVGTGQDCGDEETPPVFLDLIDRLSPAPRPARERLAAVLPKATPSTTSNVRGLWFPSRVSGANQDNPIQALTFDGRGERLLVCTPLETQILDLATGDVVGSRSDGGSATTGPPTLNGFIVSGQDAVRVLDRDGQVVAQASTDPCATIAVSRDGQRFALGTYGTEVLLWATEDLIQVGCFSTGSGVPLGLAWSHDGDLLGVATTQGLSLRTSGGALIAVLDQRSTQDVLFDPSSHRCIACGYDGHLSTYDLETLEVASTFNLPRPVLNLWWLPGGRVLLRTLDPVRDAYGFHTWNPSVSHVDARPRTFTRPCVVAVHAAAGVVACGSNSRLTAWSID